MFVLRIGGGQGGGNPKPQMPAKFISPESKRALNLSVHVCLGEFALLLFRNVDTPRVGEKGDSSVRDERTDNAHDQQEDDSDDDDRQRIPNRCGIQNLLLTDVQRIARRHFEHIVGQTKGEEQQANAAEKSK